MARNTDNIKGGFDGRFYVGRKGATAPVDPKTDPAALDFDEMGYLSDDGVSFSRNREINEVAAMGVTNASVWSRVTKQESTFTVNFMETTAKMLLLYYGQDVASMSSTAAASGVPQFLTMIEQASTNSLEYSIVIDLPILGTALYYRRFYPRVMVTETGDLTYTTNDPTLYPATFKALLASDGSVCKHMIASMTVPTAFPLTGS